MKLLMKEESSNTNAESEQQDNQLDFEIALGYINDPEVPVQGHGLIMLTNLVKEKDVQTINSIEKVFKIFQVYFSLKCWIILKLKNNKFLGPQDNITHEDTYIYLQSILGLSECANYNPTLVIPKGLFP